MRMVYNQYDLLARRCANDSMNEARVWHKHDGDKPRHARYPGVNAVDQIAYEGCGPRGRIVVRRIDQRVKDALPDLPLLQFDELCGALHLSERLNGGSQSFSSLGAKSRYASANS